MSGKGAPEIDRMAVKISHLDRLLSLTGEIIITASNMSILQRHLHGLSGLLDKDSAEMVKNAALTANRISSDLHHLVMDIRLIPIKDTFLRFRRLVRDLSKKKGRQVNFEIVGEDTLVDKTVAERLYEPLAHQIRNAIDHGLEDPLDRKQAGKDPQGRLTLKAYKKEGFTYVSVQDDGRGLNRDRIIQIAVEKGLVSETSMAGLSQEESFALVMQPGFSTAREANEISGRGVGMDVVKNTVEELGGEVIIESEPGQGSTFIYKIPQLSAVNITDALIIRADQDFFAVPIGNVVATQAVQPENLHSTMETSESIIYLGTIVPLHDLKLLLTGTQLTPPPDGIPVIIIEAKNGRIALRVSEFIRPQKLVLIPLPEVFNVKGVSGTTILGGNQLGMVLDPFELIAMASGRTTEASADLFLSRATVSMEEEPPPIPLSLPTPTPTAEAPPSAPEPPGGVVELEGSLAEEFFVEIQNILTDLNEEIFQLEREPESRQRINTIFRHFHSIKGNLIMTGFNQLGSFVHQVETILDRMRDKELNTNEEIIDLLLDTVKHLEKALAEIRNGRTYEIDDPELALTLEKYRPRPPEPQTMVQDPSDETFKLSSLAQLTLHAKIAQGENIYQCKIRFKAPFQEPFLVAYLILRRLALLGDVIETVPKLEKIEDGLVSDTIKVLLATPYDQEQIDRFARHQLAKHFGVTEFENVWME